MDIKVKAALITVGGLFGVFAAFYTIVKFPAVLLFIILGGAVYGLYRIVLNYLVHKQRIGKRK